MMSYSPQLFLLSGSTIGRKLVDTAHNVRDFQQSLSDAATSLNDAIAVVNSEAGENDSADEAKCELRECRSSFQKIQMNSTTLVERLHDLLKYANISQAWKTKMVELASRGDFSSFNAYIAQLKCYLEQCNDAYEQFDQESGHAEIPMEVERSSKVSRHERSKAGSVVAGILVGFAVSFVAVLLLRFVLDAVPALLERACSHWSGFGGLECHTAISIAIGLFAVLGTLVFGRTALVNVFGMLMLFAVPALICIADSSWPKMFLLDFPTSFSAAIGMLATLVTTKYSHSNESKETGGEPRVEKVSLEIRYDRYNYVRSCAAKVISSVMDTHKSLKSLMEGGSYIGDKENISKTSFTCALNALLKQVQEAQHIVKQSYDKLDRKIAVHNVNY